MAHALGMKPSALLTLGCLGMLGVGLAAAQDPTAPPPRQGAQPPAQGGAPPSPDAFKYGSPPALPDGLTEEQVWPAATAEGWLRPVLVKWQRTFDDAVQAALERHAPILVAVNMDGEIASEHFAGVKYRDPATADRMNRYVCVIASVYRHTPRDYDEDGARVPCPRFGTVTCGEHIEAERELYEKYFDGKRISPRHIMLDLEGNEQYDVYYSWDTETVATAFVKGVEDWPLPDLRTDRTLLELTQSADVENRERVERLYREGPRETKLQLLRAVLREPKVDQVEMLRQAIFGLDVELAKLGREALAQCHTEAAVDLMAEALKAPLAADERAQLLDAARRIGATSHRARTLVTLHEGLDGRSEFVDVTSVERVRKLEQESIVQGEYSSTRRRRRAVESVESTARAAEARPTDPSALLALSESFLTRAEGADVDPRMARLMFEDALRTAREAEEQGASGPTLDALVAIAAAELGDEGTARMRAFSAVEGGVLVAEGGPDEAAAELGARLTSRQRVRLLLAFAEARQAAIRERYRRKQEWPGEWMSDVHSAYSSIALHPIVDAKVLCDYADFLRWIGATPRSNSVLDIALRRFPDDALLHERLRARLLWEGGPELLQRDYAERVAREHDQGGAPGVDTALPAPTQIDWYAGYASLVAAEHYRRRGEFDRALAAYDVAQADFEQSSRIFPAGRDSADHFVAIGLAGRARVLLEQGQLAAAKDALFASLERREDSAASLDGLGLTAVATAKMLAARLDDAGEAGLAADVRARLDALDPKLLEPPPTELPGGRPRRNRR